MEERHLADQLLEQPVRRRRRERRRSGVNQSSLWFLALVVSAVLKAVLTRWLALGSTNAAYGALLEVAGVVAFLCIIDAIPRRRSYSLDLFAYAALVFVMYGNLLYAEYFDQLIDPSTLSAAGQVGTVADVIVEMVRPIHLLYVVEVTALVVWARMLATSETPRPTRSLPVVATGLVALAVFGFQAYSVAQIPTTVDTEAVARARGLGAYQAGSFLRSEDRAVAQPAPTPAEDVSPGRAMQMRIEQARGTVTGERLGGIEFGEYKGANVFVIQVEALQTLAYGAYYGGEEITPNINRMADDSWVCTNTFSQTSAGNTADAEFAVNASLLPPARKAAVLEYSDYEVPTLPRVLGEEGYRTVTMHANEISYWNRRELYDCLGFQKWYDTEAFGLDDKMYRGASDEVMFARAGELINEELGRQKPLYLNIVTLSSHVPFRAIPANRKPLQMPKEWKGSRASDWLGAISYADMAVGQFLDWLKETGLYDESIVIVYGDHQALKDLELEGPDKEIVEGLLGRKYSVVDRQRVPLLIHLPGQTEGGAIHSPVGQVDIAPTIADLLGVDLSETPHIGRSVFEAPDPLVVTRAYFPGGSFINSRVAFLPELSFEDGKAVRVTDGHEVKATEVERRDFERAAQLSALSDEWLRSLPKRENIGDIEDAFIPNPAYRPAPE